MAKPGDDGAEIRPFRDADEFDAWLAEHHAEPALQRQAGGHDLAEHGADRLAREGTVGRRGQPLQHRALALRNVERLAPLTLVAPDLAHHLGAPVEQRQYLIVDAVDRRAQRREIL